jgi:replicative DNA helicase
MDTHTITSGNSEIDEIFGYFSPGQFYVLAGRPMMGKMPLMLSIASACSAAVPTLFFNLDLPRGNLKKQYNIGFVDLFDDSSLLTETEFSKLLIQKKYALIVINYLQLLPSEIKANIRFFKKMAQKNNTCIVLISQLDKTCEERLDSRPSLADVKRMFQDSEQLLKYTDGIIGVYNTNKSLNYNSEKPKTIELINLSEN